MNTRVILAEPTPRLDLSAAAHHGELTYLSDTQLNPFSPDGAIGIFKHRLQEIRFDPDVDLICLSGQTLTVALMMMAVANSYPTVKLLMFDARQSSYKIRVVSNSEVSHGSRD